MINITETAAKQIQNLKSQDSNAQDDSFLRVSVAQGGCSGMSYKLDFASDQSASDKVFEEHGTKLVIDVNSYLYLAGMTLDFEGGLNGKGFIFSNPNASRTCGCGSSFGV